MNKVPEPRRAILVTASLTGSDVGAPGGGDELWISGRAAKL